MNRYWRAFLEWVLERLPEESMKSDEYDDVLSQTSMDKYFQGLAESPVSSTSKPPSPLWAGQTP